jgi:hypothetical protein
MIGVCSLSLVFAALVWSRLKAHAGRQWRISLLEAALLLGAGTILVTELLGLLHLMRPAWIAMLWLIACAAGAFYLWREWHRPGPWRSRVVRRGRGLSWARVRRSWHPLELLLLATVLGLTGLIAWLSPPTNFDAMSYQLPRVMHWFQQGTLEHYPTSNLRQLAYGPGAAYWQVQLWALFDGDLAANLPQWFALLGCALALPLWLQRFVDRRALAPAVIFGLTLPMVLLQASSSQSDLEVACWLLIAAVFLSDPRPPTLAQTGFAGLAIGLAIVTKPSAVLVVAPLALVACWRLRRTAGHGTAFRTGLGWILVSGLVCLPHFIRNTGWFGNPLGDGFGTVVESVSPRLAAANAARWVVLNVPALSVWDSLTRALVSAGIDPNLPAITFSYSRFAPASPFVVYRLLLPDEDCTSYTGALLLLGLLALAARLALSRMAPSGTRSRPQPLTPWLSAIFAGLILHFILLKWQFWGSRLLLPSALLGLPLLAALTQAWRLHWLRMLTGAWLLLQTAFVLVFSLNRPLVPLPAAWNFTGAAPLFSVPRNERFYAGYNAEALPTARQLIALVRQRQVQRVGLALDENYPEYVLWRALHDAGLTEVELYHVNARPPARSPRKPWPPAVDVTIAVPSPVRH